MKDAVGAEGRRNRQARRASGERGAHRRSCAPGRTTLGLASLGTALSVIAGVAAGTAGAEPLYNPLPPSASNPTPGTSNPMPPQGAGAIVDPPSESGWRQNPYTTNAPAYYVEEQTQAYVAPTYYTPPTFIGPVELPPPPPMIMPEPGMIRVGRYQEFKPPWITMAEMNSINRWAAYTESKVAQYWLSQGLSPEEADLRAASTLAGGIVGGAAGGAAGFALGAIPGAVGGVINGVNTTLALGLPLNAVFPIVGTGMYASVVGAGALGGMVVGGLIGGTLLGVPAAVAGVGLGAAIGGGDQNAISQPWTYRDGEGMITPKDNALEFNWDARKSNMLPPGTVLPEEAHMNFQVKTDGTLSLKLGDERWFGATLEQRDEHFYGEMDKALPGAGAAVRGVLEDDNGVFRTAVRDLFARIAGGDPASAQFNPNGDIADTSARPTRVPYPTTSTPDPWDEPNREGVAEQNERNNASELPVLGAVPTEPAPAPAPVVRDVAAPAPAALLPQPIQQAVDAAPEPVRQAVNDAQRALGDLIPGLLGA